MEMPLQIDVGNVRRRAEAQFNVYWPVVGAFMIVKGVDGDSIHFRDQDANYYRISDFDIVMPHVTDREGQYQYPRPYIYDQQGNIIRQGEVGLVVFRNGDANLPVWLGALRPGNWPKGKIFHGFNTTMYERVAERRETKGYIHERMVDADGDWSDQMIVSEDMGESIDYAERKKKLCKVITRNSSRTAEGTREVKSQGFDSRRISRNKQDPSNNRALLMPDGEYYSVRHWDRDEPGGDRVLNGHFSVQLKQNNELLIDLDSLLEGITAKAKKLVGEANVRVKILGSKPQGEEGKEGEGKNGNVILQYNGDLAIFNDAQSVKDDEVRHNLRQEFSTENTQGKEMMRIRQATVDPDTGGNATPGEVNEVNAITLDATNVDPDSSSDAAAGTAKRESAVRIVNQDKAGERVNRVELVGKEDAEKVEIENRTAEDTANTLVLDGTANEQTVTLSNKVGDNENAVVLNGTDKQQTVSVRNKVGDAENSLVLVASESNKKVRLQNGDGQQTHIFEMDAPNKTVSLTGDAGDSKKNALKMDADGVKLEALGDGSGKHVVIGDKSLTIQLGPKHKFQISLGESSDSVVISNGSSQTVTLDSREGILINAPKVYIAGSSQEAIETLVKGTVLDQWVNKTLVPFLKTHVHTGGNMGAPTGTPLPTPPVVAPTALTSSNVLFKPQ
jgi:hypothetical protein